jgi:hypothetical protein
MGKELTVGISMDVKFFRVGSNRTSRPLPPNTIDPPGLTLPFPEYCVSQTYPLWSRVTPHMSPTPGTAYSLNMRFIGSKLASLLAFDSVNHTIPLAATVMARGADAAVGIVYSSMYSGNLAEVAAVAGALLDSNRRNVGKPRQTMQKKFFWRFFADNYETSYGREFSYINKSYCGILLDHRCFAGCSGEDRFSNVYIMAQAKIIDAKTAVAKARCTVVITGSSSVITTSPPSRLWIMSKTTARPRALDGPAGRGFILHTAMTLISSRIPVTMVSNL